MCNNPLARLTTFLSSGTGNQQCFQTLIFSLILSLFVTEVLLLASRFSRASKHHPSHDGHITARKKKELRSSSRVVPTQRVSSYFHHHHPVCVYVLRNDSLLLCRTYQKNSLCSQIDMKRYESVFFLRFMIEV